MIQRAVVGILLLVTLLATPPRADEVKLILRDGRVLTGSDVRREHGNYYLTVEGGGVIPIPEPLVERVALSATGSTEPRPVEGAGPIEMATRPPAQLAGPPVEAPRPADQARVLGEPSRFQPGVFDPYWRPESDWDANATDPHRNDFAPSTWAESVVDTDWRPQSAYTEDHTQFAPSKWQSGVVDSGWVPQDGFRKDAGSGG